MMLDLVRVICKDLKSEVCDKVLRALPDWFGVEESIVDYVEKVRDMPYFLASEDGEDIGFVALKKHNEYAVEICVMGILEEYHRNGVGRKLLQDCEEYCDGLGVKYLTVKTLDESRESEHYRRTRLFYFEMGFRPIEVFTEIWGVDNPCLFMVKGL